MDKRNWKVNKVKKYRFSQFNLNKGQKLKVKNFDRHDYSLK